VRSFQSATAAGEIGKTSDPDHYAELSQVQVHPVAKVWCGAPVLQLSSAITFLRGSTLVGKGFPLAWLVFIAVCSTAAPPSSVPPYNAVIDLGWIRVVEADDGWLVANVYQLPPVREPLRSGDVIVAVGNQRLEQINALSTARVLSEIDVGAAETASVLREGQFQTLHFRQSNSLGNYGQRRFLTGSYQLYSRAAAAPALTVADSGGKLHEVPTEHQFTLIHIWNPFCHDDNAEALSEIARSPQQGGLRVAAVMVGLTASEVRDYEKTHAFHFTNLVGGRWDGTFGQNYNVLPSGEDVVVAPSGKVVFVGNGADALRNAWAVFRELMR